MSAPAMPPRAIVLVGGKGTRLRPLTRRTPKPLVPVAGRPLVSHMLRRLRAAGVDEVTLAGAAADSAIGLTLAGEAGLPLLRYAAEPEPLGSGGAIDAIARDWAGPFWVLNGDVLIDLDLTLMARTHLDRRATVTLALAHVADPSAYGVVALAEGDRIERFVEKPSRGAAPSCWVNAGVWLFDGPPDPAPATFHQVERSLFPALAETGRLFGHRHSGYWRDTGTFHSYLQANLDAARAQGPAAIWRMPSDWPSDGRIDGPVRFGEGFVAGPGARVSGPAVLGERVCVEAEATVRGSVAWDDVRVGRAARVDGSVLATGVRVGPHAVVTNTVVAHGARVRAGARLIDTAVEPDAIAG